MSWIQWLGLALAIYGAGVFVQGVRSWLELRSIARRDRRLRIRIRRGAPEDPEQAVRLTDRLLSEQEQLEARLERVTIRRALTWGLWP